LAWQGLCSHRPDVNTAISSDLPTAAPRQFDSLVRPHLTHLFGRALRFERSPVDAWDLVQDTLERGLRHLGQFRPGTNVRVWLFTIMFHIFIDRCRRRSHEQLMEPVLAEEVASPEPDPASPWEGVSEAQLRRALGRLESPFREIVSLHCEQRWSYRQISAQLHIPLGTVGTRLLRARRKLRALLAEEIPCLAAFDGEEMKQASA
jgi:RNA polymerase sigma-70 factor (ECF subfamily)